MMHRPLLSSDDFKRQIEALEVLSSRLATDWDSLQSCLDLLLLWVAARICEANTSCLVRSLAFLHQLFAHMQAQVGPCMWLTSTGTEAWAQAQQEPDMSVVVLCMRWSSAVLSSVAAN